MKHLPFVMKTGALALFLFTASADAAVGPSRFWSSHLTRKAFDRIEPVLLGIEPGTPIAESGIVWDYYKVRERGQKRIAARADGWIGFLSGDPMGAVTGFGHLEGVSEEFLHGRHVFGYLWENATLVPRYVVKTRARRSTEAENAPIEFSIGAVGEVKSGGETFFYRDVVVDEVVETRFTARDKKGASRKRLKARDLRGFLTSFVSPESYAKVVPKLEALEPGCQLLDAIHEMGGIYMTLSQGRDYILLLDGNLSSWMKREDYPTISVGDGGRYRVWPLGYLEDDEPRVQTALVFHDGVLLTVLEDASPAAVEAFLTARQARTETALSRPAG